MEKPALKSSILAACCLTFGTGLQAQTGLEPIAAAHRAFAATDGGAIWPGFRIDTIPVLYVLRGRGSLLLGWSGRLPDGVSPVSTLPGAGWRDEAAKGAASTSVTLGGRPVAQVVVDSAASASRLVALAAHEAFHTFYGASRVEGRRFGSGENSFLVTTYPVFDSANEAAVALEGRVLRAALQAESDVDARSLAARFLAVRYGRQRILDSDLANFEVMAELNEGLAEYAGLRAVAVARFPAGSTPSANQLHRELLGRLDSLIDDPSRSIRLRFYGTGPAQALLLDRLAGPRWKRELVDSNRTLQDQLAVTVGYFEGEHRLAEEARARFRWTDLRVSATHTVATLRALRRAQVDSTLAAPGLLLIIEADRLGSGAIGMCGIDPQNLLQVEDRVLLHTRWLRPCAGRALQGELNAKVVHDQRAGTLRAVIGPESEVRITAGGRPLTTSEGVWQAVDELQIEAPGASIRSARAEVRREVRTLRVRLLPP